MPRATFRNLHVPLPSPLYQRLRAEAKRTRRPATQLAREAIDGWLAEKERTARHNAIATYARQVAGTSDDLDEPLADAGVEHLMAQPHEPVESHEE